MLIGSGSVTRRYALVKCDASGGKCAALAYLVEFFAAIGGHLGGRQAAPILPAFGEVEY